MSTTPPPPPYGSSGSWPPPPGGWPPPTGPMGAWQPPPVAPAKRIDGVSIAAFVCSLTCCAAPIAVGLGIAGLVRTRHGRRSGRWAAITGLIIGSLLTVALVVVTVVGVVTFADDIDPHEAAPGECIDLDWVGTPNTTSCDEPHDGEIVWAAKMNEPLMEEWSTPGSIDDFCLNRDLDEEYYDAYELPDITFNYWSDDNARRPYEGSWLICYIIDVDSKLSRSIGDILTTGSAT